MNSHIVIVATLKVKPECKPEVVQYLRGLVAKSRAEEGNVQYNLHQNTQNANELTFIEIWASQEAIDAHNQTAHFKAFKDYIGDKVTALDISLMQQIV